MEITIDRVRSNRIRSDRKRFIRLAAVVLTAIFVLVGMRAYCAYMQHVNNQLIKENAYIQAEIDSLNSRISDEINVTRVEKVAMDKYGMVFPSAENCINLGETVRPDQNLASIIKSEAYN